MKTRCHPEPTRCQTAPWMLPDEASPSPGLQWICSRCARTSSPGCRSWAAGRVSSPEGLEPAPCSSPGGSVPNELCLHWTTETSVLLPAGPVNPRHCSCSRAQWNHTGIWGHQECAVLTLKTQREDLLKTQRTCIRTNRKTKEVWGEWKK